MPSLVGLPILRAKITRGEWASDWNKPCHGGVVMSSLGFKIDRECPKCYTDRTLLDTSFALPGHVDPQSQKDSAECINLTSALPVRLVLCPRCHLLEMYHDVG
jgi:hypothetical protein